MNEPLIRQPEGRFLRCPDCNLRGVSLRLRVSEDHWGCRYCDWFAFTGGHDTPDVRERARLASVNPEHVIPSEVES